MFTRAGLRWPNSFTRPEINSLNKLCQSEGRRIGLTYSERAVRAGRVITAAQQRARAHPSVQRISGLGITGEAIDAITPPVQGERLWYERQTQGHIVGAIVGVTGAVAFLSSKAGPKDYVARVFAGITFTLAGMLVGGVVRRSMVRGATTPA
jgi:hypothetical protein